MSYLRLAVVAALCSSVFLGVGCSTEPKPVDAGPVAALLHEHCNACHTEGGVAPYAFDTHEQTAALAELIKVAVTERTMPPTNANNDGSCHTFQDARWLDDEEIATIARWVDEGAPEQGWPTRVAPARRDIGANVHLQTPPYEVRGDTDDYRCFLIDLDFEGTKFLTGFDLIPGEPEVVHHMIAFHPNNDFAAAMADGLDGWEEGEGYTCFGASGVDAGIVAAWAPGFPATVFPEDTGIPIVGSRKLIVQMHYYPGLEPKTDVSKIELSFADSVKHPARIGGSGDTEIALAPGQQAIDTATSFNMFGGTTNTIHAVIPHMHKRGKSLKLEMRNEEGASCMLDVPRWDFDWQGVHFYETPLLVDSDELLDLRCTYDTEMDMDTVLYGDGTNDEMCFAFLYVTAGEYEGAVRPSERVEVVPHEAAAPLGAPPEPTWSRRHGGSEWDGLRSMVTHADGSVTGAGWVDVSGAPDLGTDGGDMADAFVVRFDADGELLWSRGIGGSQHDWLEGLAAAADGGVYVSGYTKSSSWSVDGIAMDEIAGDDAIVSALDADGNARWAHRIGGEGADGGRRMAAHPSGGVVSLTFHDNSFLLEGTRYGENGVRHTAIIHWNVDGTVAWVDTVPTPGGFLNELVVDTNGAVHAVGEAEQDEELAGARYWRSADGAESDIVTYPSQSFGFFNAIVVDDAGNLYVAANHRGDASYMDGFESGVDGAVLRIDPAGVETVMAQFTGPGWTSVRSLAMSPDGEVIVAGSYTASLHHAGQTWTSTGGIDVFMAKVSSSGTTWLDTMGSHNDDTYPIVHTDADRTFLTFEAGGALDLGGEQLGAFGLQDVVIMALD